MRARKNNAKIFCLICMLLFIVMVFGGCADEAKSDGEVSEEIKRCFQDDYSYLDFDSINVVIDKRQTNKEDKEDYIWATINASNDDISFIGSYTALYILYNDGWEMQYCDGYEGQFAVLRSTVTEEEAETAVWNECLAAYENLTAINRNTELYYGEDTFYFQGQYTDGYLTAVDTIKVQYCYNYRTGWELESVSCISTDETWDVLGKWEYHANGETMWLYIHEIDNDTARIEFDFDYTWDRDSDWPGMDIFEHKHFFSNGIETRQLRATENGTSFNLMNDMPSTPYVYISKTKGVTFDGYWSDPDDSYVFTYVGK